MKKQNWLLFITGILAVFTIAFTQYPHILTGNWSSAGPNNAKVILEFKPDGNFKVSVNNAIENEGRYTFKDDTFKMYDKNCGFKTGGIYKITFYTADSVGFKVINDPCADRAGEVDGGRIKRVK